MTTAPVGDPREVKTDDTIIFGQGDTLVQLFLELLHGSGCPECDVVYDGGSILVTRHQICSA